MILYKKGQMGATVTVTLVAVVAIILLVVGGAIYYSYSQKGEVEICRASVLGQSKLEITGSSPLSLSCSRRYIDIFSDHTEAGFEPDNKRTIEIKYNNKLTKRYNTLTDETVNYVIAEEMRTCWYQFGEAKTEVFPNNEPITESVGLADDDICFTCAEIEFVDIKNKEYTGLITYLKDNYPKDKKYTYWQYFNQPSLSEYNLEDYIAYLEKSDNMDDYWINDPFKFKSDEIYAVVFYKDYDQSFIADLFYSLGLTSEEPGDSPGGKSGYHVFVLPMSNVDELCEVQVS